MPETCLNTPEDLDWLFSTHLKDFGPIRNAFVAARLQGNEDSPKVIDCYSDDRYDAAYFRFQLFSDGQYHTLGIRSDFGRG